MDDFPTNWRMRNFAEGQQGRAPWWLSAEALEHWVEGFNHRLEHLGVTARLRVETQSHTEENTMPESSPYSSQAMRTLDVEVQRLRSEVENWRGRALPTHEFMEDIKARLTALEAAPAMRFNSEIAPVPAVSDLAVELVKANTAIRDLRASLDHTGAKANSAYTRSIESENRIGHLASVRMLEAVDRMVADLQSRASDGEARIAALEALPVSHLAPAKFLAGLIDRVDNMGARVARIEAQSGGWALAARKEDLQSLKEDLEAQGYAFLGMLEDSDNKHTERFTDLGRALMSLKSVLEIVSDQVDVLEEAVFEDDDQPSDECESEPDGAGDTKFRKLFIAADDAEYDRAVKILAAAGYCTFISDEEADFDED